MGIAKACVVADILTHEVESKKTKIRSEGLTMEEAKKQVAAETAIDMPIEEYRKRLNEAEHRARVAESDNALLKECIVRMALERYGVLN